MALAGSPSSTLLALVKLFVKQKGQILSCCSFLKCEDLLVFSLVYV